jgi:hypothetical protein
MNKGHKSWYAKENGKFVIEVKVNRLEQLFDKKDPNPYRSKDLDDDVVEYIVSSAQEIGLKNFGKLKVICHSSIEDESIETVKIGIKDYFLYRSQISDKKIKAILTLGVKTLLIGVTFLTLAISVSATLVDGITDSFVGKLFKEGLLLIGWVSMWKPVNIFLYEWWPLVDLRNLFDTLYETQIEIIERDKHEI